MDVRGTKNLSACLYNVCAACNRFLLRAAYRFLGFVSCSDIFFPGEFLIELGPGGKPAQQDRVEFEIGIERRKQYGVR